MKTDKEIDELLECLQDGGGPWEERLDWLKEELAAAEQEGLSRRPGRVMALEAALRWVYDRLAVDFRPTRAELDRTVEQIGRALAGEDCEASHYRPNDWADPHKLRATGAKTDD